VSRLLIVSHGQPSDPEPPEVRLHALGGEVERHLPGWQIETATLAAPGALMRAVARFRGKRFAVYPLFMSDGWFVSSNLPKRLAEAEGADFVTLPPLGLDEGLPGLVRRVVMDELATRFMKPASSTVILTAHGSPRDPRPRAAAMRQAALLNAEVKEVRIGFVDEVPHIRDVSQIEGPAISLPLFAATNGHVRIDVAEALEAAGFSGPILPPIGEHPDIPELIAACAER
jgi:sirohydrochlorin ferrochelatase